MYAHVSFVLSTWGFHFMVTNWTDSLIFSKMLMGILTEKIKSSNFFFSSQLWSLVILQLQIYNLMYFYCYNM